LSAEYLFTLRQSRDLYQTYQHQILDGDREVEKLLSSFEPRVAPMEKPLPPDRKPFRKKNRKKTGQHCGAGFDLRTEAYKLYGVDVTQIPGLETEALSLFSEVGRDFSKWPTSAHFASWLSLCPDNDISGG
jgi:hypothetical protein